MMKIPVNAGKPVDSGKSAMTAWFNDCFKMSETVRGIDRAQVDMVQQSSRLLRRGFR